MGKPPAFQMYAADFLVDTQGWTATEVGIYTRLLMSEWVNEKLPEEMDRLARISGVDLGNFLKCWRRVVGAKFVNNGSPGFVNKRLEYEREKQVKYRELQAQKGMLGGRPPKSNGFSGALTEQKPGESSSSSSSTSSSKEKNKTYSESFLIFWDKYPIKKGKPEAFKAWQKINPDIAIILSAIEAQKDEKIELQRMKKFCPEWPHPSTWINQRRWEDEIKIETPIHNTPIRDDPPAWIADAVREGWK